jgi:GT2 family glycosyltransferase
MKGKPELSIIIVSYNVCEFLLNCIQSILDTAGSIDYEIIVIDNASADCSVEAVRETFPNVQVIANKVNVGFARANNQAYLISKGDFLLLLNPDTVVKPGAIMSVLEFVKNTSDAGLAACRLLNPDGSVQKSINYFPTIIGQISEILLIDRILFRRCKRKTYYGTIPFTVDYCAGAFIIVRREALGKLHLFNADFFMYAEEKDLAYRLKKSGWNTYFVPFAEVIHYGGASTNRMPKDMYLELYRSNLIYFSINYSRVRGFILSLGLGVELLSYWLISLPLILFREPRYRLKLYSNLLIAFPGMMKKYIGKRP